MFFQEEYPILSITLALLAIFAVGLTLLNRKLSIPWVAGLSRWSRLILFSLFFTFTVLLFSESSYSIMSLVLIGLLLWLLIESIFHWLWIKAYSVSDIPLFPKYRESKEDDFWPAQKKFLIIKDWLKKHNFRRTSTLEVEFQEGLEIRNIIFQNDANKIRAQVIFFPNFTNGFTSNVVFYSRTKEGYIFISDNLSAPFGGFYPEKWQVNRFPWKNKISSLYEGHEKRIDNSSLDILGNDLTEINAMHKELENLNIDLGFLHQMSDWEENGRITEGGRYRVWKELFFLNYFGKSIS